MAYVCFVGSGVIERKYRLKIIYLLEKAIKSFLNKGVRVFYTSQSSCFDKIVVLTLISLKNEYPDIKIIEIISNTKTDRALMPNFLLNQFHQIISQSIGIISYIKRGSKYFDLVQLPQNTNIIVIDILNQLN